MELNTNNGTIEVNEEIFGGDYKEALVHQVVTAYMAAARSGTKAQKNRAAVSGGGKKPWRQKGTGRARAGTTRGPLWRTGGVTFAAQPRDFSQKVNRKMYRGALRSMLAELNRLERLVVVDAFDIDQPKTKLLVAKLNELDVSNVLIVSEEVSENLYLASRNLYRVNVCDAAAVDPVSLVSAEKVLITVDALRQLEERLA